MTTTELPPRHVEFSVEGMSCGSCAARVERILQGRPGVVVGGWDGRAYGAIAVADTVRPEAAEAVVGLRSMGLDVVMLTGDNASSAGAVARAVAIDQVVAGVLPGGKTAEIARLQSQGRVVAMVGDGINDAPALVAADLGIAIGTGTDVAREASDITMISADLEGVATATRLSRRTYQTILENLGWAFGYNAAALPLAAVGLLSPAIAGAAMGLSSVSVVANALRLYRFSEARGEKGTGVTSLSVRRSSLVAAWLAPVVLLGGLVLGWKWVAAPGAGVDRTVYLNLSAAGFTPDQLTVASGERIAFVVHNQSGRSCAVALGSYRGPAVASGATGRATITVAGRGQVPVGCAGGPSAAVAVR